MEDKELVQLRAELQEYKARATYASIVAETALSAVLMEKSPEQAQTFLRSFLKGLRADISRFPGADSVPARVAGLFAAYAAKWDVKDEPG